MSRSRRVRDGETDYTRLPEQSCDGRKFNRGKLLNAGFDLAHGVGDGAFGSYIFHDVDLLPGRDLRETYLAAPRAGAPVHVARLYEDTSEAWKSASL